LVTSATPSVQAVPFIPCWIPSPENSPYLAHTPQGRISKHTQLIAMKNNVLTPILRTGHWGSELPTWILGTATQRPLTPATRSLETSMWKQGGGDPVACKGMFSLVNDE
jgi:hypothetical protein